MCTGEYGRKSDIVEQLFRRIKGNQVGPQDQPWQRASQPVLQDHPWKAQRKRPRAGAKKEALISFVAQTQRKMTIKTIDGKNHSNK